MLQSPCIGDLNFCCPNVPIFYLNPCYMSELYSCIAENNELKCVCEAMWLIIVQFYEKKVQFVYE